MKIRFIPALVVVLLGAWSGPAFAHGNGQGNGNVGTHTNNGAKSSNFVQGPTQPYSNADKKNAGANTTSPSNPYKSTGYGQVQGGHYPGSVGKADNKFPPGHAPNGSDLNRGYECDQNPGIGNGNPAHSACLAILPTAPRASSTPRPPSTPPPPPSPTGPSGAKPPAVIPTVSAVSLRAAETQASGAPPQYKPRSVPVSGALSFTGSNVIPMALAGAVMLAIGSILVALGGMRRRKV